MCLNRRKRTSGIVVLSLVLLAGPVIAEGDIDNVALPPAPEPSQLPFDIPELSEEEPDPSVLPPAGVPPVQTGAATYEDIRDIRGPIDIPSAATWIWTALAALAGLLVLLAAWRMFRRRSLVRARRAFEVAFDRLEQARAFMHPEQAREFSLVVSEAVRTYIDQRFGLRICRSTTQEFVESLVSDPDSPLRDHTEPLRDFLGYCDLAKFARWSLSIAQMEAMHSSAWQFVESTRPRSEEETKSGKHKRRNSKHAVPADSVPALATGGAS